MGLHVGHVERRPAGYVGLEVHRAARVAAAAHGGQLLLTSAARELADGAVAVEFLGAHRLKDFPAPVQLYCAVIDGRGASAFPPPRAYDVRPTNLPAGLPALIGRDTDLHRVSDALLEEGERLVTLTGRGGAGKTALALEAGTRLLEEHRGGVWWVALSRLTASQDVLGAVSAVVGADREVQLSAMDAICAKLRDAGPVLVILDNFEHLLDAGSDLTRLLDDLPELRLLLTSQVPTHLPLERVIPLDALDDEAALSLIERVARRRGARITGDREALLETVRLLDGLPLALELAGARLALLTPSALRDRLATSLELLRDPARPERQRSLQATVEWTLSLLEDSPRELFIRLGAFAGPVELEELELVCGGDGIDVLEALATLLDAALVRRVESGDGRVRFGLPEALRQIAARRLDAAPDGAVWRRAHAERQLALMVDTWRAPLERLMAMFAADEESAAALRWARRHDRELADRLGAPRAAMLGNLGRLRESEAVLEPLLADPPRDADVHAEALAAQAALLTLLTRYEEALRAIDDGEALGPSTWTLGLLHIMRGMVHVYGGDPQGAVAAHREATRLARPAGGAELAGARLVEAQALIAAGELEAAGEALEEAERVGKPANASVLRYLDSIRGDLAVARGRAAEGLERYARSLESAERRRDDLQVFFDLRGSANALGALGRDEDALEVAALAARQATEVGLGPTGSIGHLLGEDGIRAAQERLGSAASDGARARAQAVPRGQRVARACALAGVGAAT